MAYIGKSPVIGNFVKLDAITAVNGQAAYTMQNGGSNFTDYESVNQFLVSLNGTIQAPTDSFTVSGSTLTFASNLSTGDVIDFIMVFGNSLSAGTPTDGTVTSAKISYPLTTFSSTGIDDNATSTAMTIDSDEKVGIGTGSPNSTLTVSGDLTVSKTGDNVKADFSNGVNANFRVVTSGAVAQIGPSTASDLVFLSSNAERMRMLAAGGLTFGGDTAAANALDDYEEGTFTPDTNIGFSSVVGEYVKIGKMVHFAIQGTFNAGPGDGSQASSITGLPFSASPGDQLAEIWVVTHNEHVIGQVGGTTIGLKGRGDGVNITRGQIGSKGFQATGTYHVDL